MKKISQPLRQQYPPLKLYNGDLRKLLDELSASASEIELIVGDYKFNDIFDLEKNLSNQKINKLDIRFLNPYGTVSLNTHSASLFISEDSNNSAGLFHKLDKVLSSCLRKPLFVYSAPIIFVIQCLILIADLLTNKTDLIFLLLLTFIWQFYIGFIGLRRHSTIILKNKSDSPNFFVRKADEIWLIILGAVIGQIIMIAFNALPPIDRNFFKYTFQKENSETEVIEKK